MILQASNITCIRERPLFTHLSFHLNESEMLVIEGPNGSGKSSLLRLLTGIATPSAGEIRWQSHPIQTIPDEYQKHFHYIGHESGIKSHLTVEENLQLTQHLSLPVPVRPEEIFPCFSAGRSSRRMNGDGERQIFEVIELLQLTSHKNTFSKNLSAGQKRRLALAKLFLLPRKLWLLDEPLTALDTATQTFFLTQLENHLQQGGMVIMSSHQALTLKNKNIKSLRLQPC